MHLQLQKLSSPPLTTHPVAATATDVDRMMLSTSVVPNTSAEIAGMH